MKEETKYELVKHINTFEFELTLTTHDNSEGNLVSINYTKSPEVKSISPNVTTFKGELCISHDEWHSMSKEEQKIYILTKYVKINKLELVDTLLGYKPIESS